MAYEPILGTWSRHGNLGRLTHLEGVRRAKVDEAVRTGLGVKALALAYTPARIIEALQVSLPRYRALARGESPARDEASRINHWCRLLLRDLQRLDESHQVLQRIQECLWAEWKAQGTGETTFRLRIRTEQLDVGQHEAFVDCLAPSGGVLWTSYATTVVYKTAALALRGSKARLVHVMPCQDDYAASFFEPF